MPRTLHELLAPAPIVRAWGDLDVPVTDVTIDSRRVTPGVVFVARPGARTDGHEYVADAVAKGAVAVVSQHGRPKGHEGPWVQSEDLATTMAVLAAGAHDDPSAAMNLVGITGTNGKTTTCYLLEAVIAAAGRAPGVLGTVSVRYGGQEHTSNLTTPESTTLQRQLATMRAAGVTDVAMEVSSHGIELGRITACKFAVGVFSNLSRDHLDFHGTMESYGKIKKRFMVELLAENPAALGAAVNLDDEAGRDIAAAIKEAGALRLLGFSVDGREDAAVRATSLSATIDGVVMDVETPRGPMAVRSPLLGHHNAENILAAVSAAELLGLPHDTTVAAIAELGRTPGRLDPVENPFGFAALVDYAHTDDALANVTRALRPLTEGRLITVFGCGGDRDATKRPEMGRVAITNSDIAIATSDNPRTEEPGDIVSDILPGLRGAARQIEPDDLPSAARGWLAEVDRRTAIRMAVLAAKPGDTILVAGKGHEDYQILGTEKIHFDDREEIAKAVAERRGGKR